MMSTRSKEIKAVHVADLARLLQKYEQLENFKNGNVKCHICSGSISLANVGSMKRVNKKFVFTCNKIHCYDQLVKDTQQ